MSAESLSLKGHENCRRNFVMVLGELTYMRAEKMSLKGHGNCCKKLVMVWSLRKI